jgi:hypothetical protein
VSSQHSVARAELAAPASGLVEPRRPKKPAAGTSNRLKIVTAIAALSISAAGLSLFITLRPESSNVRGLKPADISERIPLTAVRRSGEVVLATVVDAAWLAKPDPERRGDIEAAATSLRAQDATELVLLDNQASPIATLVVRPDPVVTFTRVP